MTMLAFMSQRSAGARYVHMENCSVNGPQEVLYLYNVQHLLAVGTASGVVNLTEVGDHAVPFALWDVANGCRSG